MSMPLSRAIIGRAYALIVDEKRWCWGALARDEGGRPVEPTDEAARRWCAFGALIAAAHELVGDLCQAHHLADFAARKMHRRSLSKLNDMQGHAAVLALFQGSIDGRRLNATKTRRM